MPEVPNKDSRLLLRNRTLSTASFNSTVIFNKETKQVTDKENVLYHTETG